MLRHSEAGDYILATGQATTVRDFVSAAYGALGIDIFFDGSGMTEVGIDLKSGKPVVSVNPQFFRHCEPGTLIGDARKAAKVLGWRATVTARQVAELMALAEYESSGSRRL